MKDSIQIDDFSKQNRLPGSRFWSNLLWVLIVVSFGQFRWREAGGLWEEGGIDTQVIFQAVSWILLTLVSFFLVLHQRPEWRLLKRGVPRWYFFYAILALFSVAYSIAPGLSAYRAAQLLVAIILVISLNDGESEILGFIAVFIGLNWVLVVLAALGLDFGIPWIRHPDYATARAGAWRFASSLGHPMSIGFAAAMGTIWVFVSYSKRSNFVNIFLATWFMLTLLLTVSRTAMVGLVAGLLFVAIGHRAVIPTLLIIGTAVPVVFLVFSQADERAIAYVSRGQTPEEMRSLTGRRSIYDAAADREAAAFILGEGFRAARRDVLTEGGEVVHAHNAFLEARLGLGIPGFLATLAVVGSMCVTVARFFVRGKMLLPWGYFSGFDALSLLLPIFAYCVLTVGIAGRVSPFLILFLIVVCWLEGLLSGFAVSETAETFEE